MKSSWKRQRQAAKNKQIKLLRWLNSIIRKYGFKNVAELVIRVSEAMRSIADYAFRIMKQIIELRLKNETIM